jgi:hypothetical protein
MSTPAAGNWFAIRTNSLCTTLGRPMVSRGFAGLLCPGLSRASHGSLALRAPGSTLPPQADFAI